jgi:hypothetical protein
MKRVMYGIEKEKVDGKRSDEDNSCLFEVGKVISVF